MDSDFLSVYEAITEELVMLHPEVNMADYTQLPADYRKAGKNIRKIARSLNKLANELTARSKV